MPVGLHRDEVAGLWCEGAGGGFTAMRLSGFGFKLSCLCISSASEEHIPGRLAW